MLRLPQLRIDQEPKPEGLKHTKDESFYSIQEATSKEVAKKEESNRTDEQRCTLVEAPVEPLSLYDISRCARFDAVVLGLCE